jgi:hypothetical protein
LISLRFGRWVNWRSSMKDLPVANFVLMEILNGRERLLHNASGIWFRNLLVLCDVVEKFSSFAEFCHEKANSVCFPSFEQFNDVWMFLREWLEGDGSEGCLRDFWGSRFHWENSHSPELSVFGLL